MEQHAKAAQATVLFAIAQTQINAFNVMQVNLMY